MAKPPPSGPHSDINRDGKVVEEDRELDADDGSAEEIAMAEEENAGHQEDAGKNAKD